MHIQTGRVLRLHFLPALGALTFLTALSAALPAPPLLALALSCFLASMAFYLRSLISLAATPASKRPSSACPSRTSVVARPSPLRTVTRLLVSLPRRLRIASRRPCSPRSRIRPRPTRVVLARLPIRPSRTSRLPRPVGNEVGELCQFVCANVMSSAE